MFLPPEDDGPSEDSPRPLPGSLQELLAEIQGLMVQSVECESPWLFAETKIDRVWNAMRILGSGVPSRPELVPAVTDRNQTEAAERVRQAWHDAKTWCSEQLDREASGQVTPSSTDTGDAKAGNGAGGDDGGDAETVRKPIRRGRPKGSSKYPPDLDARIAALWKKGKGQYKNKDELDAVFGTQNGYCRAALERDRKKKRTGNSRLTLGKKGN